METTQRGTGCKDSRSESSRGKMRARECVCVPVWERERERVGGMERGEDRWRRGLILPGLRDKLVPGSRKRGRKSRHPSNSASIRRCICDQQPHGFISEVVEQNCWGFSFFLKWTNVKKEVRSASCFGTEQLRAERRLKLFQTDNWTNLFSQTPSKKGSEGWVRRTMGGEELRSGGAGRWQDYWCAALTFDTGASGFPDSAVYRGDQLGWRTDSSSITLFHFQLSFFKSSEGILLKRCPHDTVSEACTPTEPSPTAANRLKVTCVILKVQ